MLRKLSDFLNDPDDAVIYGYQPSIADCVSAVACAVSVRMYAELLNNTSLQSHTTPLGTLQTSIVVATMPVATVGRVFSVGNIVIHCCVPP